MKERLIIATIMVGLTVSGCAQLMKLEEKGATRVSQLIISYCATTLPATRIALRKQINRKLQGIASIRIDCY